MMSYYHITAPENLDKILKGGIKADDEKIWLFDSENMSHPYEVNQTINVPEMIARNQCFLEKYIVIKIDENGITGELSPDNVAEFTASAQWILKQEIIKSEFLTDWWDETCYK